MIGKIFRVSFFGESHGRGVGVLLDGCPPGVPISEDDISMELAKRRIEDPNISTQRVEVDDFEILSGVFNGYTTGAPLVIFIYNRDVDSRVYEELRFVPRPSHADYTAWVKYFGYNDYRGGGIFSGRLTAAMVAAGAIAKRILGRYGIEVYAHVVSVGDVSLSHPLSFSDIKRNTYRSPVRCADPNVSEKIYRLVERVRREGDSVGGVVEAVAINVPPGLGDPPIDTLDGEISRAIFVIPGVKGIEFGGGFRLSRVRGSVANDPFRIEGGRVVTTKNDSGGINGGISSGMPIVFRVAFKPTPSIYMPQRSVDLREMREVELRLRGRFDPCIAIKAVPVVESIFSIVLADFLLRWLSWREYMS
jgi:chorismate synthase